MHATIETLMHEHRVVEKVLDALEVAAEEAHDGHDVERARVRDIVEILSGFADRCHHGKEEDILFASMVRHGFPGDRGPIGVMLQEHDTGRAHVRALATVGSGEGPLDEGERQAFVAHALSYVSLLRQHIAKEDQILYPMALQALPTAELDELAAAFAAFERDVVGQGEHERLHALADRVLAATAAGHSPEAATPRHACHHTS